MGTQRSASTTPDERQAASGRLKRFAAPRRWPFEYPRSVLELGLFVPGQVSMPAQELREAVPGLAGIAGALVFPTLGAWVRLLLEYIEWNRPGIGKPKRISGLSLLRAVVLSMLLSFFVFTLFRAASELRDLQAEAQVVGPSMEGALVGIAIWAIYALAIGALRRDVKKRRNEHRFGTGLLR